MKTGIEPAKSNQNWDLSNKQLDFFYMYKHPQQKPHFD